MKKNEKFIKLAIRTIGAQSIILPFALNSVVEVSVTLPATQFDLFYQAFVDRAIFVLTVIDLQCVFEGLIMEIHKEEASDGNVNCRMKLGSIYRIIFDNSITEKGVIAALEYEKVKLGQKFAVID